MQRMGIDPIRYDTRPLHIIMDDEIPWQRWSDEFAEIKRLGYSTWQEWQKAATRSAKTNDRWEREKKARKGSARGRR
jgi:hypothetical protein